MFNRSKSGPKLSHMTSVNFLILLIFRLNHTLRLVNGKIVPKGAHCGVKKSRTIGGRGVGWPTRIFSPLCTLFWRHLLARIHTHYHFSNVPSLKKSLSGCIGCNVLSDDFFLKFSWLEDDFNRFFSRFQSILKRSVHSAWYPVLMII